jgi:DNA-binding beta-propeller fold protein YncE
MKRRAFLAATGGAVAAASLSGFAAQRGQQRLLYIAQPGIRNYQQYGGVGVLVYDIDRDYAFVRRIPTWTVPEGAAADNVKGVAASAATGRLWVSTIKRLACIDLASDRLLWDVAPEGGCDRLSVSPDGRTLYVPSFEGPHWNVIDGLTGETRTTIVLDNRAHNTLWSPDGTRVYLEGLTSPYLTVADARTHRVVSRVGPFSAPVRPFTVNAAQTHCYVNVNDLLGFEVSDLATGAVLHQVVVQGYQKGPVARHACPSHGIGLTPDEKELWVCDGHNSAVHVFDNTVMPPRQVASLKVRDQPGWITFSLDGAHAWPSTGEVFDVRTKRLVKSLRDEVGREIGSEKLLEIDVEGGKPVAAGNSFGGGVRSS